MKYHASLFVLENQKNFCQNKAVISVRKFFCLLFRGEKYGADFQGAFRGSHLKRRLGTAVPTVYDNIKSTALPCFLRERYQLGRLPQTLTQRTFCEKSFGISKACAKMKW